MPDRRLAAPALVWALILVATLWPQDALPDGPDVVSVAFHVVAYGLLALTLRRAGVAPWRTIGLVLLLGVANEALQSVASTGRSADPWDVVADLTGAALVVRLHP